MKLTSDQIERAVDRLDVAAVANAPDLMAQLVELYGDHTFFVDADGLHILEMVDEDEGGAGGDVLTLVQLAAWSDETMSEVVTHEPRATGKSLALAEGPPVN
jgi:hypothetical protein